MFQKSANDIAKEMLKWAKKQEKASKVQMSLKPLVKPLETKSAFDLANGGADVAHKMLEKSQVGSDEDEVHEIFPWSFWCTLYCLACPCSCG